MSFFFQWGFLRSATDEDIGELFGEDVKKIHDYLAIPWH